ncbi:MAG TPA: sigma-70 family RNA polymerase sigma factor [Polyangia bacterium]|nr:sigma-70 family RNA polymerase sigma factor [Polyangia bacterium]
MPSGSYALVMAAPAIKAPLTFEACYAAHAERVYHWCLRLSGGDPSWAQDVAHDVFVRLLEQLPTLSDPDDLGGWLYRVTMNLGVSRLRRDRAFSGLLRRVRRRERLQAAPPPDLAYERREAAAAALATLRELPARERAVACMKLFDGKSQLEIATVLGLSKGYVSKLVARAWERIRQAGWELDDVA